MDIYLRYLSLISRYSSRCKRTLVHQQLTDPGLSLKTLISHDLDEYVKIPQRNSVYKLAKDGTYTSIK